METQKRITVWFLETASEALLISVLLIILSGFSLISFISGLALGFFGTLHFFFITGYLFTTAIADALWRKKRIWVYPSIVSILFSTHLQIAFWMTGGWTSAEKLPVRIAGPCIVFACTFAGSSFLLKRQTEK